MLRPNEKVIPLEIQHFINELKKIAEEKGSSAAFAGSRDDGGRSDILNEINFYVHGINHTFPPEWNQYLKEIDPTEKVQYEEYLKLKKKFE